MAQERLDLIKNVYNKTQYIKTIDTSFSELGTLTTTEELQAQPTVEEFFALYNSLFYDIPALGETNSHQFLVRTSGEYINFDEVQEEIQALQAEIAQLRSDLLKAQMDNIRSTVGESQDDQSNVALDVLERELESASDNLIETSNNLANNAAQTSVNQPSPSGGGGSSSNTSGPIGMPSGGGGGGGY
jgi:uncharacterized phage infection (PIP) family protein YhgE|tara:strand:- start:1152 stop:1712 length:561 start_codon:yes stop_codon:yes gene_type:complete